MWLWAVSPLVEVGDWLKLLLLNRFHDHLALTQLTTATIFIIDQDSLF